MSMPRRTPLSQRLRFGLDLLDALRSVEPAAVVTARITAAVRSRDESFLAFVERDLWQAERRPHRELLEIAGWNPFAVRAGVAKEGLEPTLERMAGDGVFLDAAEAKGRMPIVRRGREVRFTGRDLEAVQGPAVPLSTSGSSGQRSSNPIDLAGLRLQASYMPAMLAALAAERLPLLAYYPAPSAAGIAHTISFALAGKPPDAWFCHLPEAGGPLSQWRLWLRVLVAGARLRGVALPLPQLAEVERPAPLAQWLVRRAAGGAVVATFPGSALRLQSWARAAGVRLPPIVWILGGEPVSPRKRRLLEEDGHRVFPWYGAVDLGRIAVGCLRPEASDDMHLLTDRFAAISRHGELLLTSIHPAVHRRLLNAATGDLASISRRSCGCPFEDLGLGVHLHSVHSHDKLTLDGVTLPAELVHALAGERLPAACGGSPEDYQIVEEEGADGSTRLLVVVDPALAVDERQVLMTVHAVLSEASGSPAMAERLRRAGAIAVRRGSPRLSRSGKAAGWLRARS